MALNVVAKSPRRLMAQSTRKGTGGKERNIYTSTTKCVVFMVVKDTRYLLPDVKISRFINRTAL